MEVHHHPDLHHPKKYWKEYFLEFLMIFFAVSMSFIAENIREGFGDKTKEKEYLLSLVNDLKYDTAQYAKKDNQAIALCPLLDSLYYNIKHSDRFNNSVLGKWNHSLYYSLTYRPVDASIQQLQNSGNFRLIENKSIADSILIYESTLQRNLTLTTGVDDALARIYKMEDDMCDYDTFNNAMAYSLANKSPLSSQSFDFPLVVTDRISINQFANAVINYKAYALSYAASLYTERSMATALIGQIKKEYDLQ
jgi:hypothetical protein